MKERPNQPKTNKRVSMTKFKFETQKILNSKKPENSYLEKSEFISDQIDLQIDISETDDYGDKLEELYNQLLVAKHNNYVVIGGIYSEIIALLELGAPFPSRLCMIVTHSINSSQDFINKTSYFEYIIQQYNIKNLMYTYFLLPEITKSLEILAGFMKSASGLKTLHQANMIISRLVQLEDAEKALEAITIASERFRDSADVIEKNLRILFSHKISSLDLNDNIVTTVQFLNSMCEMEFVSHILQQLIITKIHKEVDVSYLQSLNYIISCHLPESDFRSSCQANIASRQSELSNISDDRGEQNISPRSTAVDLEAQKTVIDYGLDSFELFPDNLFY
ncbi:MAG: hypothetical protein SFT68_03105 [Rickettsiaceae bacterium]|nr:hypothetical protein [Rickettsiaceae bacterium]